MQLLTQRLLAGNSRVGSREFPSCCSRCRRTSAWATGGYERHACAVDTLEGDMPTRAVSLDYHGLGPGVGRDLGVGADRGVGVGLGVTVAVGVAVAVAVGVGLAVGVGVGVPPPDGDTRT